MLLAPDGRFYIGLLRFISGRLIGHASDPCCGDSKYYKARRQHDFSAWGKHRLLTVPRDMTMTATHVMESLLIVFSDATSSLNSNAWDNRWLLHGAVPGKDHYGGSRTERSSLTDSSRSHPSAVPPEASVPAGTEDPQDLRHGEMDRRAASSALPRISLHDGQVRLRAWFRGDRGLGKVLEHGRLSGLCRRGPGDHRCEEGAKRARPKHS